MEGKKISEFDRNNGTDLKDTDNFIVQPNGEVTKRITWSGLYAAIKEKIKIFAFDLDTNNKSLPGAINELLKKINETNKTVETNDKAFETGTYGVWKYRKHKSGIYECWTTKILKPVSREEWGAVFVFLYDTQIDYPIKFAEEPCCIVTIEKRGSGSSWISTDAAGDTAKTGKYSVVRPTDALLEQMDEKFSYYVVGRWK